MQAIYTVWTAVTHKCRFPIAYDAYACYLMYTTVGLRGKLERPSTLSPIGMRYCIPIVLKLKDSFLGYNTLSVCNSDVWQSRDFVRDDVSDVCMCVISIVWISATAFRMRRFCFRSNHVTVHLHSHDT